MCYKSQQQKGVQNPKDSDDMWLMTQSKRQKPKLSYLKEDNVSGWEEHATRMHAYNSTEQSKVPIRDIWQPKCSLSAAPIAGAGARQRWQPTPLPHQLPNIKWISLLISLTKRSKESTAQRIRERGMGGECTRTLTTSKVRKMLLTGATAALLS